MTISPIDISLIVIARMPVPCTRLPLTVMFEAWTTMPSSPPETSQPSTAPMPWKPEYEMSIPCVYGPERATVQSRITICEKRTWIPSSFWPMTRTPSSLTLLER